MRDIKFHVLVLSALSVSSVATYLGMFHSASSQTAKAMSVTPDSSVGQQLSQKKQQLQDVAQKIQTAQNQLQTATQNYQQAYSVIQQDDQVLKVLNQRLQNMGIKPVPLPSSPKPLKGVNVSSTPPPIVTTSRAS